MLQFVSVVLTNSLQVTASDNPRTGLRLGAQAPGRPVDLLQLETNPMLCPFLTDAQVEELDRFGMIELTDEIMQDMLAWAGCEQMQQDDAQSAF